MSQVREFFELLYADCLDGSEGHETDRYLVVFSPGNKAATWSPSLEVAARVTEQQASNQDVHFGTCMQSKKAALAEAGRRRNGTPVSEESTRGFVCTTVAMPGLWLDVDVAGEGHEKKGLPPDWDAARSILEGLPLQPTALVNTSGGLHAWWLFKEMLHLTSEVERRTAQQLLRGWQDLARRNSQGYVLDGTHDLARVLRAPGTINHKRGQPVILEFNDGPRWNPHDFEEWTSLDSVGVPTDGRSDELRLSADANPPAEKLALLLKLHSDFMGTWERTRKFASQSEYDLSLAAIAARSGFNDQEIADLIIAHRRSGEADLKLDRQDYYARTISKARIEVDQDEIHQRVTARIEREDASVVATSDMRQELLKDVSELLGIDIKSVTRYPGDFASYDLELAEGTIHLGDVDAILSAAKFRKRVAALTGKILRRYRGEKWDPIAQALLQACNDEELGSVATEQEMALDWLNEFFLRRNIPEYSPEEMYFTDMFLKDGSIFFLLSGMRQWLRVTRGELVSSKIAARMLRKVGCVPERMHVKKENGQRSTRAVWRVPQGVLDTVEFTRSREE